MHAHVHAHAHAQLYPNQYFTSKTPINCSPESSTVAPSIRILRWFNWHIISDCKLHIYTWIQIFLSKEVRKNAILTGDLNVYPLFNNPLTVSFSSDLYAALLSSHDMLFDSMIAGHFHQTMFCSYASGTVLFNLYCSFLSCGGCEWWRGEQYISNCNNTPA